MNRATTVELALRWYNSVARGVLTIIHTPLLFCTCAFSSPTRVLLFMNKHTIHIQQQQRQRQPLSLLQVFKLQYALIPAT